MRHQKVLLGLACLAANTMLLNTAHADRRTGLGGNLLIEDKKDLFAFPQYTLKYRNMLNADYGATTNTGQGVMTFGTDSIAVGLSAHRGDILTPDFVGFNSELGWITGVQNPLPLLPAASGGATAPASTFVDLVGGFKLSETSSLGARIGFGRAANLAFNEDNATGQTQTFVTAQVGFSTLPPEGLRLDLSGNVLLAFGDNQLAGDDANSALRFRVGGLGRAYLPINNAVDLGVIANVNLNRESTSLETGTKNTASDLSVGFMAGAGPVIHIERATLAAYGGLMLGYGKAEPDDKNDDDEVSRLNFVVPDVRMSAEVQLLDWLYVRTGLDYLWQMNSTYYAKNVTTANGNPGAPNEGKTRVSNGTYQWNAGLGVEKGNFNLDGVIQNAFMTNGPNFIGGGTGFLAMASLTYRFGDVFNEGGPAPQEAGEPAAPVEPAPVEPAPAPEPAPEQESAAPATDASATGAAGTTETGVSAGGSIGVGIGKP